MADVYIDIMTEKRLKECGDREEGEIRGRKVNLCKPNGNPHCPYRSNHSDLVGEDFRFLCHYFEIIHRGKA